MIRSHTPEAAARHLLGIFARHGCRAGDALPLTSFVTSFNADGWRTTDLNQGLPYAVKIGWLATTDRGAVRLTEAGARVANN